MSGKAKMGALCIWFNAVMLASIYLRDTPEWLGPFFGFGIGAGLVRIADWWRGEEWR